MGVRRMVKMKRLNDGKPRGSSIALSAWYNIDAEERAKYALPNVQRMISAGSVRAITMGQGNPIDTQKHRKCRMWSAKVRKSDMCNGEKRGSKIIAFKPGES